MSANYLAVDAGTRKPSWQFCLLRLEAKVVELVYVALHNLHVTVSCDEQHAHYGSRWWQIDGLQPCVVSVVDTRIHRHATSSAHRAKPLSVEHRRGPSKSRLVVVRLPVGFQALYSLSSREAMPSNPATVFPGKCRPQVRSALIVAWRLVQVCDGVQYTRVPQKFKGSSAMTEAVSTHQYIFVPPIREIP